MIRFHLAFTILCLVPNLADGQETQTENKSKSLQALNWMAGSWASEIDGVELEETWMAPKSGLMLGINRTVGKNGKTSFEFFRIIQEGNKITYLASPGGRAPTPFVLTESSGSKAVFENIYHDFPQRIIYRRDKDRLHARIEGKVNGKEKSSQWFWDKVVVQSLEKKNKK